MGGVRLIGQIVSADKDSVARLQRQMDNVQNFQYDVERAHERIKDKVERQIPQDLNELSQKLENFKKQMGERIDREEEERLVRGGRDREGLLFRRQFTTINTLY